jgi:hypothetical protein
MTLTTSGKTGGVLGRLAAINSGGGLVAMVVILITFQFHLLNFRSTFVLCGILALIAAIAIVRFPSLDEGRVRAIEAKREPLVLRRKYRFYYLLNLLDGGRQQIFFSFGLWVLVDHFRLSVPVISGVLIGVTTLSMTLGPWIGHQIDRRGVRQMLEVANVGYVIALAGYALIDNVVIAIICYMIYSFIMPLSNIGASTYLRKVADPKDIAPSLAMGVTMQHAAAIVVPVATGFILTRVGYQVPFLIACVFASLIFFVTRRLGDVDNNATPIEVAVAKNPTALTTVEIEEAAVPNK